MFVSDVSDFQFIGKVEPYFLSAGEEVYFLQVPEFSTKTIQVKVIVSALQQHARHYYASIVLPHYIIALH